MPGNLLRAACGVLAGLLFVTSAAAEVKWDRAGLAKFLEVGFDRSLEARPVEENLYTELEADAKGDWRLTYATTLVRMKQLRYQDAIKSASDVLERDKTNAAAWRAKIWLTVLTKNYMVALADLEKLADSFPAPEAAPDKDDDAWMTTATFLGRVFGYLDGPVAASIPEANRVASRRKISARLPERHRKVFDQGREAVTDQFLAMTDQALEVKEKVKETQEEQKEEKLKDLEAEQKDLEQRRKEQEERRDKLRTELQSELATLQRQEQPLLAQYNRLDAQAGAVRARLAPIASEINRLLAQADREKDPNQRERLRSQANGLRFSANRLDAELDALSREGARVQAQVNQIRSQAVRTNAEYSNQIAGVDKNIGSIDKRSKGARNEEKKVRNATTGDAPVVRAKSTEAMSFITYEKFPLELERQRLVESLPK